MKAIWWAIGFSLIAASVYAASIVQLTDGDEYTSIADVTVTTSATLVSAADGARVALNCTNTSSSIHVRWGDASITASRGQQFRAGTSITIRNVGAVYMIAESTTAAISCTKESF